MNNNIYMGRTECDNIKLISQFLEIKDINIPNAEGKTYLIIAAQKGYIDVVTKFLSVPNIDVNLQDNNGDTALMLAAERGYTEVVTKLLSVSDIDVNLKDNFNNTALILAAERGYTEVVTKLLSAPNIDINLQDNNGDTALMLASQKGYAEVVTKLLLKINIDVNLKDKFNNTALILATYNGHDKVVTKLLSAPNININLQDSCNNRTALMIASQKGDAEIVAKLLASKNININLQDLFNRTALMLAAEEGHVEIVAKLLALENIDVNLKDDFNKTAAMYACEKMNFTIVWMIVNFQAKNNTDTFNNFINELFKIANSTMIKYIIYSGKALVKNYPIERIESLYKSISEKDSRIFLQELHNKLSPLPREVKGLAKYNFPNRIKLLEAEICGISFKDNVQSMHTNMSTIKFKQVSFLMRLAVLTKIVHKFNSYIAIHTLMIRESIGNFSKLSNLMIENILNFLVGGPFKLSTYHIPCELSLVPSDLKLPNISRNKVLEASASKDTQLVI